MTIGVGWLQPGELVTPSSVIEVEP